MAPTFKGHAVASGTGNEFSFVLELSKYVLFSLYFFVQNLFLHFQISNYCSFVFTANKEGNCTGIFFPGFRSIGDRLNLAPWRNHSIDAIAYEILKCLSICPKYSRRLPNNFLRPKTFENKNITPKCFPSYSDDTRKTETKDRFQVELE